MDFCLHILGWKYVCDEDDNIVGRTCTWCKKFEQY